MAPAVRGQRCDVLTVPEQPSALEIHHLGKHRAQLRKRTERNGDMRHRLDVENRGERVRLFQRLECERGIGDERPSQVRVEMAPAAPTDLEDRGRFTAQVMCEDCLFRNVHDPRGLRQLRPAAAFGDAASVPSLVHVVQCRH